MLEKITAEQLAASGVVSAPDKLVGKPKDNKLIFDRLVCDVVAPAYNACVDVVNTTEEKVTRWNAQENGRVEAEKGRTAAEKGRVSAEAARAAAETERVNAEKARAAAEARREDAAGGMVAQATASAKAAANSAAAAAESERRAKEAATGKIQDGSLGMEKLSAEVQAVLAGVDGLGEHWWQVYENKGAVWYTEGPGNSVPKDQWFMECSNMVWNEVEEYWTGKITAYSTATLNAQTGEYVLSGAKTYNVSGYFENETYIPDSYVYILIDGVKKPCRLSHDEGVAEFARYLIGSGPSGGTCRLVPCQEGTFVGELTSVRNGASDFEAVGLVKSEDAGAYPHNAYRDGLFYEYLGVPNANAISGIADLMSHWWEIVKTPVGGSAETYLVSMKDGEAYPHSGTVTVPDVGSFTYRYLGVPFSNTLNITETRLAELEAALAEAKAAIAAQYAVSVAQDEALIELYERMGG